MGSGLRKAVAAAFMADAIAMASRTGYELHRVSERTVRIGATFYSPTTRGQLRELTAAEVTRRIRISRTVKSQYAAGKRARIPRTAIVITQPPPQVRAARRASGEPDYPDTEPWDMGRVTYHQGRLAAQALIAARTKDGSYARLQAIVPTSEVDDLSLAWQAAITANYDEDWSPEMEPWDE